MKNKSKDVIKAPKQKKAVDTTAIMGMLQVFVLVSIGYSTYLVALGAHGYVPRVMLIPQALYAAILLIRKFTK